MKFLAFLKWIGVKISDKIFDLNNSFKRGLYRNAGETFFFWFLFTLLASVANLLAMAGLSYMLNARFDVWCVLWLPLASFAHLVYTGISVMYHCFKQERAELFETIKNGR